MFSKAVTTAAVALAASSLVSAQTSTACNPLKQSCPPDPALGNNQATCDFTQGPCSDFDTLSTTVPTYGSDGALFKIESESDAPTIRSKDYIFFGSVEIVVQAAPGQGIVTSFVLQSDDLDEIDVEWIGSQNTQVQSNYFSKGNIKTYDRGENHTVSNPTGSFHTYTVQWNSTGVVWLIDNDVVRTLTEADTKDGDMLPQTPMQIKLGTWVGGSKDAPPGTVQWAGGYADFSQAPFNAYYKSITIVDYAGSDEPASKSVKQYVYSDNSGSWESITVESGNSARDEKSIASSDASSQVSSSASGTATSSGQTSTSTTSATATATSAATTTAVTSHSSGNSTVNSNSTTAANTSIPSTVQSSGSRSVVAFGSVIAVGAGVLLTQLFL